MAGTPAPSRGPIHSPSRADRNNKGRKGPSKLATAAAIATIVGACAAVLALSTEVMKRPAPSTSPSTRIGRPGQVFLTELQPLGDAGDGGWILEAAKVNGILLTKSLTQTVSRCCVSAVEYDLSRTYTSLNASVGLRDDSPQYSSVAFTVIGDGVRLAQYRVGFGELVHIDVDVRTILRLTLEAATNFPDGTVYATWGDVTISR